MTYRVTWTPRGHVFPQWRDFWAEEPARLLADAKRAAGEDFVGVFTIEEDA